MSDKKPGYETLEARLAAAETLIEVLKGNEVDAIIGQDDVSFIRGRKFEEQAKQLKAELERLVAERTARLRNLTIELTQAEQRERQRLAELLHDHLQQLIAGARLRLGMLKEDLTQASALENITKIEELMNQAMQASRSLSQELSPPDLFSSGLGTALERLAEQMHELHGLTVAIQLGEDTEPECENVRILLFQSVRELLFNVVKHARTPTAHIQANRHETGSLRILVADDGDGFDPEKVLNGETEKGFGLFSIRERLKALGGAFEIVSAPARGTRISLFAPLHADESEGAHGIGTAEAKNAAPEPLPENPSRKSHQNQKEFRILIADDHKLFREGLASMLGAAPGMKVIGEARDGQMAVDLARELQPDVIIMDVSMPRLNGVEATRIIASQMPDIRVIALSMHPDEINGKLMRRVGAEAFLTKDTPLKEILAAIHG